MTKTQKILKGRIKRIRSHGGITFVDYVDNGRVIKASISRYNSNKKENFAYKSEVRSLFVGACIEISDWTYYKNKTNEYVQDILDFKIVSEKYFFPQNYPSNPILDTQQCYKEPSLTRISDPTKFEILKNRFKIFKLVREFFESEGATEVDIPVLEESFGGAFAKPFITKANYNKKEYFLRVAFEFPLKKLIIEGFPQVFHIGSSFRNENLDHTHSFEFSQLEYYTTEHSYEEVKSLVEKLFCKVYYEINGTYIYEDIDLRHPWKTYTKAHLEELMLKHQIKDIQTLQKSKVLGPFYHLEALEDNPLGVYPYLFESYVDYDMELTNSYQEQSDSQKIRAKMREKEFQEILDENFLKVLDLGMVNTVGLGIGLDRLVQVVLGQKDIRAVQTYPKI